MNINPAPSTRVIDAFTQPVKYRMKMTQRSHDGLAVGTPRGNIEEAAGYLLRSARLIAQARTNGAPRTALLDQIERSILENSDLAAAVARGMS